MVKISQLVPPKRLRDVRSALSFVGYFVESPLASAAWKNNRFQSFDDLVQSRKDGYWIASKGSRVSWDQSFVRCINDEKVRLPQWWGTSIKYPSMKVVSINNAFAYRKPPVSFGNVKLYRSEVWSSDSVVIRDSMLHNSAHLLLRRGDINRLMNGAEYRAGCHVHLGHIAAHYGHFVLEGLSRAWINKFMYGMSDVRYVANARGERMMSGDIMSKFEFIDKSFTRCGIDTSHIDWLDGPAVFEKMLVPSSSFYFRKNGYCAPSQIPVWDEISGAADNRGMRKIYLSRRRYSTPGSGKQKRPVVNEHEVEDLFSSLGYDIVYPEKLSFDDQLRLYSECSSIAGICGSNMHNTAFAPSGSTVIIIAPTSFVSFSDYWINAMKGNKLNYFFVEAGDIKLNSRRSWAIDVSNLETSLCRSGLGA